MKKTGDQKENSDEPPNGKIQKLSLQQNVSVVSYPEKLIGSRLIKANGDSQRKIRHWREWHEREIPVRIRGFLTNTGLAISVNSSLIRRRLKLNYPPRIWKKYPKENKIKLLDNVNYIFTAHLPFLLRANIRLEYNTGYPHVYSWAAQGFMRHLPAYWYLNNGRRGTKVFPILKTLLNSNVYFSQTIDAPPSFPDTIDENVIIPFTFGKDSMLTYHVSKDLGLRPTLLWFNDPVDEGYEGKHKKKLIENFSQVIKEKIYYIDNPLGSLRERGEGWFGWELALTSWALLALPFAYYKKAGYIIFSNEKSANSFFYDENGMKIVPDYEQSGQATEELSIITQALSEGEVYTTTFAQGLHELAVIGILKQRYFETSLPYLMSCWSENEYGRFSRWCANCSKCARIYAYLSAHGVDPKIAGFKQSMFTPDKERFFNVFGKRAAGTGWDAFGLNTDEQSLAFYLSYQRGIKEPLVLKFANSPLYQYTKSRLGLLVDEYLSLHPEYITPTQWKTKINRIFNQSLSAVRKSISHFLR